MKKYFVLLLAGLSSSVFAGMPIDYQCKVENGTKSFIKITKKNKNILLLAVKVNDSNCTLAGKAPLVMYWKLGEKVKKGVAPCQRLNNLEYKLVGLRESDGKRINAHRMDISYEKMSEMAMDLGDIRLDSSVTVELKKVAGVCRPAARFNVEHRDRIVDRLHMTIRGFGLSAVEMYQGNNLVIKF
jgi:hypothetical protein